MTELGHCVDRDKRNAQAYFSKVTKILSESMGKKWKQKRRRSLQRLKRTERYKSTCGERKRKSASTPIFTVVAILRKKAFSYRTIRYNSTIGHRGRDGEMDWTRMHRDDGSRS